MNLTIFYDERQVVDLESFSPSAKKPKAVVESWLNIKPDLNIQSFKPVTEGDLKLIHNPDFVENIFSLRINNGFENKDPRIPESLLWTNGSFLAAALHAAKTKEWAISPTSGFHHAEYNRAMGFCTFNGLMLAAKKILDEKLLKRIAIVDLDMHYGNGTDSIINELKLGGAQPIVLNYTFGGLGFYTANDAEKFLNRLPRVMEHICVDYDIILYQAGADPHVNDPFGGVLTNEQLRLRDDIVFEACHKHNKPIAWNLAGGYQTPLRNVLDIHDNTLRSCLEHTQ